MVVIITRLLFTALLLGTIGSACYGLFYVWTHPVSVFELWKKDAKNNFPVEQKTIIPSLDYKITYLPTKYASGLEVDGIIWKDDYVEYRLFVGNSGRDTEVHDVRINMDLPGGIVQYKVLSEVGCSGLKARDADTVGGGVGKRDGTIIRTVKQYSNNFYISIDKLFPEAYFDVRLILKVMSPVNGDSSEQEGGILAATYRYVDAEQKIQNKSEKFKIVQQKNHSLYIDTKNPLTGEILRSTAIVFDTPLTLGGDNSK